MTTPWKHHPRTRMSASARRAQIIDSATGLIAERGFWGFALRDVAAECGITEAGVLHHAHSKDGLLVAVLEHRDEVDRADLVTRLGIEATQFEDDPFPVGLRALCTATVTRNASQPEIVRLYTVLQGESLDRSHPAHDFFQHRERRAIDLLRRAAGADGTSPAQAALLAREALAAMDGLQLRWLRDPSGLDFVATWEDLAGRMLGR